MKPIALILVLTENDFYSRQMKKAMTRISIISAKSKERSGTRDWELLILVDAIH